MMQQTLLKTGIWGRSKPLEKSIIKQIIEIDSLAKAFKREYDKQHRQPVARFRHAVDSGVTISALNKLRFAADIPSIRNLYKERKEHRMHVDTVWCPSGPELVRGTTRTFAEQEQGARDEVNDEDERDDHLPEDDEPPPLSSPSRS